MTSTTEALRASQELMISSKTSERESQEEVERVQGGGQWGREEAGSSPKPETGGYSKNQHTEDTSERNQRTSGYESNRRTTEYGRVTDLGEIDHEESPPVSIVISGIDPAMLVS